MNQDGTTGETRWRLSKRQIIENNVIEFFFTTLRVVVIEEGFLLRGHKGVIAIRLHCHFA